MDDRRRAQADADALYLGNLHTVEADLTLPTRGRNGSDIRWQSQWPHIIGADGRVDRPREGAGDREVALTAVVCFGTATVTRTFAATVLERQSRVAPVRLLEVVLAASPGAACEIPSVVIVEQEDGSHTTAPVEWLCVPDFARLPPGEYLVQGAPPFAGYPALVPRACVRVDAAAGALTPGPSRQARPFPLKDARVDGGVFAQNRDRMLAYLLSLEPDSLLYTFRQACGLDTQGAAPMTGWDAPESLLRGHTTGHYLSAMALGACCPGHEELCRERAARMVAELARCQRAFAALGGCGPGFLSAYGEEQFLLLEQLTTYPTIWAPYYTLHKLMAGLLDCCELAGNRQALAVAQQMGRWAHHRLGRCGRGRRQSMWALYIAGEYGGMNEVMARLYGLTREPAFLQAARWFDNDRLFYPMLAGVDTLGGLHANQHIVQMVGALELYAQTGLADYYQMARHFWQFVVRGYCYAIGGTGEGEMFQRAGGVAGFLTDRTAESCASYNMLKLTGRLWQYRSQGAMMDYCERVLLNHILPSHDHSGPTGDSTYFMPLCPAGRKTFDRGENTCCHGTGLESHLKYQENAYHHSGDDLYVNLYMPSTLHWREKGMTISQTAGYPLEQRVELRFDGEGFVRLRLRVPGWLERPVCPRVNGRAVPFEQAEGYAVIGREFRRGDVVCLELPFRLRTEACPDDPGLVSVFYGPLVLAVQNSERACPPLPPEGVRRGFVKDAAALSFTCGGRVAKPLYMFVDEPYSVYFSRKE